MSVTVTENFQKSRNRLIYFSSIGALLCFYPVKSDSSLFGLSFENLKPDTITYIFFFISLIVFIEFMIRLFEEMPVLWGQHADLFQRIKTSNFQKQELRDALDRVSQNFDTVLSNQSEITEQKHNQLISAKKSIERHIEQAEKDFSPGKFSSKAGKLRVWVEFLSGILVFVIYLIIFILRVFGA